MILQHGRKSLELMTMTKTESQIGFIPELRPVGPITAGLACAVCNAKVNYKDVVLTYRERSTINNEIQIQPVKVIHKYCITGVMDADAHLQDEYDKIKQRVVEKGTLFDD